MENKEYKVDEKNKGKTLQAFLSEMLGISRNKAKNILNQRNVFVNSRRIWMVNHILRQNDTIRIPSTSPTFLPSSIDILYEDNHYLIVDKKPGILSNGENSVETILAAQLKNESIRAVHRLDKDTSGCLIAATSGETFEKIIPFFRKHAVQKTYHAIASGRLANEIQTINTPIDGENAVTHIRVLDSNKLASHIIATIETGRTHQIRRHLASIGAPLVGDRHYATKIRNDRKLMTVGRHMLHASSISLEHPMTGGKLRAKAPLPHDFRACLKIMNLS